MRDAPIAGLVNKGAGIYGYPAPSHVTKCVNSNNPYGHSPSCPCLALRASQSVPYLEPDEGDAIEPSPHESWWPAENDVYGDQMREEREFGD